MCQFPYVISPKGGSINITCSFDPSLRGVYLKQSRGSNKANVIYYEEGMNATVDGRFWGRITFGVSQQDLTITIQHLQLADTGTYVCQGVRHMNACDSSILVVVTGRERTHPWEPGWPGRLHLLLSGHLPSTLAVVVPSSSNLPPPGSLLDCPTSEPLPALNPKGSHGLPYLSPFLLPRHTVPSNEHMPGGSADTRRLSRGPGCRFPHRAGAGGRVCPEEDAGQCEPWLLPVSL